MTAKIDFDAARNTMTLGEARLVFHCHHYNLSLQRTVEDALGYDVANDVQRAAAAEAARRMLAVPFAGLQTLDARLAYAKSLFAELGFGVADLAGLDGQGGRVVLHNSHYAVGRRSKWGVSERPACAFPTGFWAGALASAAQVGAERVLAEEKQCAAMGSRSCEIAIEVL
jgi:hypothetical protein